MISWGEYMTLKFKGFIKDCNTLEKSELPQNAVKFKEPENAVKLNLMASVWCFPLLIIILIFEVTKNLLWDKNFSHSICNIYGVLICLLFIIIHELLHAICFPKNAQVNLYFTIWGAFVVSSYPITKIRFIILSLLPSIILGIIPLIVWVFIPKDNLLTQILFSFGSLSLLMGCADMLNVFNAITQMPKGSVQQLSGFNSYWYMP